MRGPKVGGGLSWLLSRQSSIEAEYYMNQLNNGQVALKLGMYSTCENQLPKNRNQQKGQQLLPAVKNWLYLKRMLLSYYNNLLP